MGLFGKKKEDDAGLDVISEIKEPFSFEIGRAHV